MDDNSFNNPFDQDEPVNSTPAHDAGGMTPISEESSGNRPLIWILLGVIVLGCGFIFVAAFFFFQPDAKPMIAQYFPSATATPTQTPTPTPTITPTPTNTPTPTPNMTAQAYESTAVAIPTEWHELVSDNFDTNENNWYTETDDGEYAIVDFKISDGKYIWDATSKQGFVYWLQSSPLSLTDFYFSVEATQPGFTTAADYGIYFREDNSGNFYYFNINNKGKYSFWMIYQNEWQELITDTQSSAIHPREANKLAVLAEGDHFIFFINDQYVNEFTEDTLTRGWAGMIVEISEPDLNIVFEFDNPLLMRPK
jgi:hypothetical protein